jgi:hypothetical protein
MDKGLEKKMYFFVPYNISEIQKGIQAGHCVENYADEHKNENYNDYLRNHKTWMIMNGGTTRDGANQEERGDMNCIEVLIREHNKIGEDKPSEFINYSIFREPDLNHALTAICFLCDERVFNYDDYMDWKNYAILMARYPNDDKRLSYDELKKMRPNIYKDWVESLGGEKNVFLRELLKGKKLA